MRVYALKKNLIDIPNERSSHTLPTPRGGGVGIAVPFLCAILLYGSFGELSYKLVLALLAGGGIIALIGLIDDFKDVAPKWRLLVQFLASISVLYFIDSLPINEMLNLQIPSIAYFITVLFLVWLLNLYNFMDGINGIAAVEAITTLSGGIVLLVLIDAEYRDVLPLLILLSAVVGFLFWNFPKAKIFMGDVGSGFIGILLGIFSIEAGRINPDLFWAWLILLGVFIVDSTFTLIRRLINGERVYEAHSSHAYQHAARQLKSHTRVTVSVAAINLLWLTPVSIVVVLNYLEGVTGLVIAYIPLIYMVFYYSSGKRQID